MKLETYNKIIRKSFVIACYTELTNNYYEYVTERSRTNKQVILYSVIVDRYNRPTKQTLSYDLLNYMAKD